MPEPMGKQLKTTFSASRQALSIPPDVLIDPLLLKYAQKIRAGRKIGFDPKFAIPCTWDEKELGLINDGLLEWLKQGDIDTLAALIKSNPVRIVHPVIRLQLTHLKKMARCLEESDSFPDNADVEVFRAGTRQAAQNALLTIFQGMWNAFSSGILSVKHKHKRGHPRKWEPWEMESFLEDDFNPLMDRLEYLGRETENLDKIHGESQAAYLKKIAEVVQQLHFLTSHSYDSVKPRNALGDWDSRIVQRPISLQAARLIARQAIPKQCVQKHVLVAGLFAHHMLNDHTKWRRLYKVIERAEEMFPHLHRPKTRHTEAPQRRSSLRISS